MIFIVSQKDLTQVILQKKFHRLSEIHMAASKVYAAYHNLWRIEESFRVMKSQLDARPVYLQKQETITGHFLICYLAVLLTRILQIHILKNQYGTEEIFDFIRDFRVAKISDRKYINLSRNSSFIKFFSDHTGLPLTSYFMGNTDIKKVLSHRFQSMAQHYFFSSTPKDRQYSTEKLQFSYKLSFS